jgi:hypothetical protein
VRDVAPSIASTSNTISVTSIRRLPYSIRSQSRGKLGRPSLPKADEFAIDREAVWEVGEFGHEAGHVPAATALDAELSVAADERAEAVPFGFERVAAARRSGRLWFGRPRRWELRWVWTLRSAPMIFVRQSPETVGRSPVRRCWHGRGWQSGCKPSAMRASGSPWTSSALDPRRLRPQRRPLWGGLT